MFIAFILPWSIYFSIIWIHAIQVRPDGWYAAYLPHWGDGIAHLSYMASFAFKSLIPTTHPLFLNHPFTYSFGSDWIGGLLTRSGLPLWFAYNVWGLTLSIALLCSLWLLIKRITHSNIQTWLTVNLFLTSGGLGWKYLIIDKLNPTSVPDSPYFPLLLTQRENTSIAWLNTIVGELIPQRAFLLALPLGAILLWVWYRQFVVGETVRFRYLIFSGLLFGIMPIVHPHTTMVLATVLVFWSLDSLLTKSKRALMNIAAIGIPAVIVGSFFVFKFLTPSVSSGFFKWYPGWLALSKNINWISFWWDNWGLFLPVAIISTFFFVDNTLKRVLYPFWLWFIVANLFLFQPYDWDNSKLFTWVYLFLAIPVAAVLVQLFKGRLYQKILALILFITMTLAGGIDAYRMLDTKTYALQIVTQKEIALANTIRTQTPADSIILTSTTHRNWVPILTGRQILCGYLGWMWTYGIDADHRVADIKEMYAGSPLAENLLNRYGIDYVVIGPEEKSEFMVNEAYFAARYPLLTSDAFTTVYRTR